ncbi:hypothetical protein KHA90_24085 [Flavobacterium psychroterrae]|uniref:Uncharacterized protein n=1 Tax=Flavobacterium psychroterrae TaxID=2133767 RepID=A0ABS5PID4_9FLAO|nr:hypothetical protein [Flavobacterium psychroterrae]MBS7234088.1 hypothetical protein [Flavobacterium psychroterrae]
MIETSIAITVNRKSDIEVLQQKIIENRMQFPVYICEYENSYQINFTSDYEEWELDTAILNCFPDYEFTTDLDRGRKEIRIQISRYQSELSTDGWGRRLENPLDETKYLIKKSVNKPEKFNPKIKVLFEDKEQYYYVNIVNGINKANDEKGFLLVNDFKTNNEDDTAEILKDKLYKSPIDAFHSGYNMLSEFVEDDFRLHLENKKKKTKEIEKLPRKIIRDFIKACNSFDEVAMFNNLDKNVVYEKRLNWKTTLQTDGITEFKEHLKSSEQTLCRKNFKIRSSWTFNLPRVIIGVKYFPVSTDTEKQPFQKYGQITFTLESNLIIGIMDES